MTMMLYTMDPSDVQKNANIVKEVVLAGLEKEGFLEKGKAVEIGSKYAIIMHERGWLGALLDKWFDGIKEKSLRITFVKIIS
jgi:hypothetical protein